MIVSVAVDGPQLLRSAARAASLDDRLAGAAPVGATDPDVVASRLATWRGHVADGDRSRFERYLVEVGLRTVDAGWLVHDAVEPPPDHVPTWLATLADLVNRARDGDGAGDPMSIAFGHLWTAAGSAVRHAVLARLTADQRRLFDPGVIDQLNAHVLGELSTLGGPTLYEAFSQRRRELRRAGTVREAYDRFIDDQRRLGLPSLVVEHPVLGRLVAQRVDELTTSFVELVTRLHADLPALVRLHDLDGDPGVVTSIVLGWSDRHRRGRTVARVAFERGLTVAYKPKPLGAERALGRLLSELAAAGLPTPRAPDVLSRDGYGWARWIDQQPCTAPQARVEYFRAAGTLLGLTSALGGTDLLAGNIVAAGDVPAVVDAEMIAAPRLRSRRSSAAEPPIPADAAVLADLQGSVVDTGLLPWVVGATRTEARDVSGLTGRHVEHRTSWWAMNTADMIPTVEPPLLRRTTNAVISEGVVVDPGDHVDDLVDGYVAAQRWMTAHPTQFGELVARSDIFDAPARYTFRATGSYELIARLASHPDLLRDGLARSMALDAVNNTSWWTTKLSQLHADDPAGARQVAAEERAALERLDVPLFVARPTDRDLRTERDLIGGVFRGSPRADLGLRLQSSDDGWLARQVLAIGGCFEARDGAVPGGLQRPARHGVRQETLDGGVRRIADLATARAVRVDGTVSWLVIGENHLIRHRQLMPIGPDLYGGRAGLGIFLAAAAARLGDDQLAVLAADCLRPLADFAAPSRPTTVGGALTGTASAVYGLALGAGLLGDERLAAGARRAASTVAETADIAGAADGDPGDVASGVLGAALALAAASRHGAGPVAIDGAMRLGAVALTEIEASMDATDGHRGGAAGTAGVAHGLMGQALAFDRLHAVTGDPRFAAAADAALHRADAALRDGPAAVGPLIHSWCQGEVGVATVALTARQRCSSESWQARVAATIESVRTAAPFVDHSVCCGRGGAVELLLLAGDHSGARAIAGSLAATADGDWRIGSRPGVAPLLLGFHRGLAGVGYAMLRAMEPSRFPAVLTWR